MGPEFLWVHLIIEDMNIKKLLNCFSRAKKAVHDYSSNYNYRRAMDIINDDETKAYEYLKKEVEDFPENGLAHYWIARICYNHDMYGPAITAITQALSYSNNDDKQLAECYCLRAWIYYELKDMQKMVQDTEKSLKLDPAKATCHDLLARYYYDISDYDKSIEEYKKYDSLIPGEVLPYAGMAFAEMQKGDYKAAEEHCEYAIKLDANNSLSHELRGQCYLKTGRYVEAIDDFIYCITQDINNRQSIDSLVYGIPQEYQPVLLARLETLSQQKKDEAIWPHLIGQVLHFSGRYREAVGYYEESFQRSGHASALSNAANSYRFMGQYELSLEYLNRAREAAPDEPILDLYFLQLLSSAARFEEAETIAQKCIKNYPDNEEAYNTLAFCQRNLGKYKEALESARIASLLNPHSSSNMMQKARCLEALGEEELMHETLEKIISMENSSEQYSSARLNAYVLLGHKEAALCEILKDHDHIAKADYFLDSSIAYSVNGRIDDAERMLELSMANGYNSVKTLRILPSLKMLQELPNFDSIVAKRETDMQAEYDEIKGLQKSNTTDQESETIELPFIRKDNMVYVKGNVNGLPLDFIFDTGCFDVSLSNIEAAFMKKNGYLSEEDFGKTEWYRTASGDSCEGKAVNLKELSFGGVTFKNVRASILSGQRAPLLLGQSMMSRLANLNIDNDNNVIRFTYSKQKT